MVVADVVVIVGITDKVSQDIVSSVNTHPIGPWHLLARRKTSEGVDNSRHKSKVQVHISR